MLPKHKILTITITTILIFTISLLPKSHSTTTTTTCNQSCGGGGAANTTTKHVPYPFGFSPSCPIQLNCTQNSDILIGEFPIRTITPNTVTITLHSKCDRPIKTFHNLFTKNYAPTINNGILMQNCTSSKSSCTLPLAKAVHTNFESFDCNITSNISCYSHNSSNGYLDMENFDNSSDCKFLLSSISVETFGETEVSLGMEAVQLGWWLEGICDECSDGANCTEINSPVNGLFGYRCRCDDGLVGDGYRHGLGCQKASTNCNASKYMSGQCGGTTRVAALIGGIIAGAILMGSLGLICYYSRRRSTLQTKKHANRRFCEASGITSVPIYSYRVIEKATNYFSENQRLGTGAYGTVYSGKLGRDDKFVAIKRIKHRDIDSTEQVMNEIKLLSCVSHPNLVRLLGCSIDNGEQILVYEFMPNGTLSQHLHRTLGTGLPWHIRLSIASETARAIAHLHSAITPPIYHRDIKSSNILLDNNFTSKVADFGLSRLGLTESSHISTAPQGTPGYVDPQYHQDFHLSDKSDVYSFGVVLVEIITAMKVVDFNRPQNEVNLAAIAIDKISKGCLDEIIDPFLKPNSDAWTLFAIHKLAELAFRCLAFHRDMRPSMVEVASELEQIRPYKDVKNCNDDDDDHSKLFASVLSSSCSSSNLSEKPLSLSIKKMGLCCSMSSKKGLNDDSLISEEDSWLSEQSSPSTTNSLLSNAVQ